MKILKNILLFVILIIPAFAELPVKVDYAVFNMFDSLNIIEVYYSFPDNCLKYNIESDLKKGVIGFAIGVVKDGTIIDSVQWMQEINIPANGRDYVSDLVGIKTMTLPKGDLQLKFIAMDMLNKSARMKRIFDFVSPDFSDDKISASDLQIASIIEPEKKATQKWNKSFKKNGLYVVPNPGKDVLGVNPKIYSYFEIYNAKIFEPDGLTITYTVENAGHREVFFLPRQKKSYADAMVEYIAIPVDALPTGVYYFKIKIKPADGQDDILQFSKKIFVSNYEIPPQAIDEFYENMAFEQSEFATLSEKQVETLYDQIKFLATDYENEVWDECQTLGARQRFLFTYWTTRNTDTTQPYNVALEEFRRKIDYANKHFKYGLMKEGWRTDRGRVYIKYGPATRIERFVQEGDKPAYEKWFYDEIQGGVEFVFIDFRSNGYYRLVHSSAEGEMYNYNWYEQYIEKQDPDPNFEYQKSNIPR
jgi:GWxTD domain-containing protein